MVPFGKTFTLRPEGWREGSLFKMGQELLKVNTLSARALQSCRAGLVPEEEIQWVWLLLGDTEGMEGEDLWDERRTRITLDQKACGSVFALHHQRNEKTLMPCLQGDPQSASHSYHLLRLWEAIFIVPLKKAVLHRLTRCCFFIIIILRYVHPSWGRHKYECAQWEQ